MAAPTIPAATTTNDQSADPPKTGWLQSMIRTVIPVLIGQALAWVAIHWHIVLGPSTTGIVKSVATVIVIAVVYGIGRWLETRKGDGFWPKLARGIAKILISLGIPTQPPTYPLSAA